MDISWCASPVILGGLGEKRKEKEAHFLAMYKEELTNVASLFCAPACMRHALIVSFLRRMRMLFQNSTDIQTKCNWVRYRFMVRI